MAKYKYLCQCCGEDYIVYLDSKDDNPPECPHCGEDCFGKCKELGKVEE
ncbi:MAG: hypothetical protein ACOCWE_02960 [Bacillota bacterium]